MLTAEQLLFSYFLSVWMILTEQYAKVAFVLFA